ncbi:MAG: hypothetical protein AAFN13_06880 [Bacteroidota bacterium]
MWPFLWRGLGWAGALLTLGVVALAPDLAGQPMPASAQPRTNLLSPDKLPSQYRATPWTSDDGLPQSNVDALAQSTDGYVWAATLAGVGRFDGVAFETISTRTHPSLRSNNAIARADPEGSRRISSQSVGVIRTE